MFGFFKRPGVAAPIPTAEAEPDRYKGRPILIILEQYVLHCIGAGDNESDARLLALVQRVWGGGNDWRQTVRTTLNLDSGIDDAVRGMWSRNLEIARQNNTELHPIQFAKMVADTNFVPLIDK